MPISEISEIVLLLLAGIVAAMCAVILCWPGGRRRP